ncbi:hypothetical protein Vafri_13908, partial [Volvox africanus]
PGLQVMTHLWEPLRASYRPLLLYGITEVLALLCRTSLLAMGCSLSFLQTDRAGNMLVAVVGLDNEQLKQQKLKQEDQYAKEQPQPQPQPQPQQDIRKTGDTFPQSASAATVATPMGCSASRSNDGSNTDGSTEERGGGTAPVPVVLLHG